MKKTLATLIAGLGLVAMVGSASAAEININIYGASAQYKFWNAVADDYLASKNCTDIKQAQTLDGKTHGITKGTCPNAAGGSDTVYIRYTSKASYDGIYACKGELAPGVATGDCLSNRQRKMADPLKVTSWTKGGVLEADLKCTEVTIGASDVAGDTFGQQSSGLLKGCNGASTKAETRDIPAIATAGMTSYNPIVVPFGFFANNALEGVDNLTRLQALMLFSGGVWKWSDFGDAYPSKDAVVCLRHAGSGTHATLSAAVMRNDATIAAEEACPFISFNDGSGDMMACLNTNGGESADTAAAVGYADADALVGSTSYANVKALKYEGAEATRSNIQNGVYSFWSAQWLYECNPSDTLTHPMVVGLNAYASNGANLTVEKLGAVANYWCSQSSLKVVKANDFVMPVLVH